MTSRRDSPWPTSPGDEINAQLMRCLIGGGLAGTLALASLADPAALVDVIELAPIGFFAGLMCGAVLTPVLYVAGRRHLVMTSILVPAIAAAAVLLWFTRGAVIVGPMIVTTVSCSILGPWAAGVLRVRRHRAGGPP